jgi:hypothetical protein
MSGWMVSQSRFSSGTTVTATEVDLLPVKLEGSEPDVIKIRTYSVTTPLRRNILNSGKTRIVYVCNKTYFSSPSLCLEKYSFPMIALWTRMIFTSRQSGIRDYI